MNSLHLSLLSGTKDLLSVLFQSPFSCDWSHWANGVLTYWFSDSSPYHAVCGKFFLGIWWLHLFLRRHSKEESSLLSLDPSHCTPLCPWAAYHLSLLSSSLRWASRCWQGMFFHSLERFGIRNKTTSQMRKKRLKFC